jgi:uncharacterized protein YndB with AHSA1/START domain
MTKTISIAPVKKSLVVETSQAHAFDVFTNGIDRWWPKEHHLGETPVVKEIIEPRKGGRWYSTHRDGKEVITGHFLVWDPPRRIVFSWEISPRWKHEPDIALASEVEVRFIADGPARTRVELEHRKFEAMADVEGAKAMREGVDKEGGWSGILDLYRKAAET